LAPFQTLEAFFAAVFGPTERLFQGTGADFGPLFLMSLLGKMIIINIGLAIFNLLPFGPLDGASIMRGFLPWKMVPGFDRVQPALAIVVLVLFFIGGIKYLLEPIFGVALRYYIFPLARLFLGV
jgi:Zn-dependent protease